jgi:hypothetical protein
MNRCTSALNYISLSARLIVLLVLFPFASIGFAGPHQQKTVRGPVARDTAIFSSPDREQWHWRLDTTAEDGWTHVHNTQRPHYGLWRVSGFSETQGFWESRHAVTADSPDRHFQVNFYGQLKKSSSGTGGGEKPHFTIEGRTDSSYFVLPGIKFTMIGQEVEFWAEDGNGARVASNWASDPATNITLTPCSSEGQSVKATAHAVGIYEIIGEDRSNSTNRDRSILAVIKPHIAVDTNRDGVIDERDEEKKNEWSIERGAFMTVDLARTNVTTWAQMKISSFGIPQEYSNGMVARLAVHGNRSIGCAKHENQQAVFLDANSDLATDLAAADLELFVAAQSDLSVFPNRKASIAHISLNVTDTDGNAIGSDRVAVQVAPIIIPWNALPMSRLYVTNEFPDDVCADKQVKYAASNPWTQDIMELGLSVLASNNARDQLVSLAHPQGPAYTRQMMADVREAYPRWHGAEWSNSGNGGNIEVYPPYENYPYGRVVMLPKAASGINLIQKQGIQSPVELTSYFQPAYPSGWLAVGHIDELFNFVRDGLVLRADPALAWREVIDMLNTPNTDRTLYVGGPGTTMAQSTIDVSAGINFFFDQFSQLHQAITDDATTIYVAGGTYEIGSHLLIKREVLLITHAEVIPGGWKLIVERQQRYGGAAQAYNAGETIRRLRKQFTANVYGAHNLQSRIETLENELREKLGHGLTCAPVPVIFGPWNVVQYAAYTGNMVNSVTDGNNLYVTNPGNERFRQLFRQTATNMQVTFSQGDKAWNNYHRRGGEIHCGSNAQRTLADPTWWTKDAFKDWGN